jgi:hypothetical protein
VPWDDRSIAQSAVVAASFWTINLGTLVEAGALLLAVLALGWELGRRSQEIADAESARVQEAERASQEAAERAAYAVRRPLRSVRSDTRSVAVALNEGAALLGIGSHLFAALERLAGRDGRFDWDVLEETLAAQPWVPDVAVVEAWSTSPVSKRLIDTATSLRLNAQELGAGLAFIEPAVGLLHVIATGFREPDDLVFGPVEERPEIAQGLQGPIQYLALQFEPAPIHEFRAQSRVLRDAVVYDMPRNAAGAFVASGQHEAALRLRSLIEESIWHLERLSTADLAQLVAATPPEVRSDRLTDEVIDRLVPLGELRPDAAKRLRRQAEMVKRALDGGRSGGAGQES